MAQRNHIQTLNARSAVLPSGSEERLERLSISGGDRWVVLFENSSTEEAVWTVPVFPAAYQGNTLQLEVLCISTATSGTATLNAAVEAITSGDALDLDSANSFDSANSGSATVAGTAGQLFTISITLTNKDNLAVGDHVRIKLTRDTSDSASGTLKIVSLALYEDVASLDLTDFDSVTQPETIVVTADANEVPLTVKGANSQVDNLQEWQNSAGTVQAKITKQGYLVIESTDSYNNFDYIFRARNTNINTSISYHAYSGDGTFSLFNTALSLSDGGGVNRAYLIGSSTGGLFLNTNHTIKFGDSYLGNYDSGIKRNAAGILEITNGSSGSGSLIVGAYSASTKPLLIKGATSQTAALTEWQDFSGNMLLRIKNDGDRPVIQWGDTASDNGLSIRNHTDGEIIRFQDNGYIVASNSFVAPHFNTPFSEMDFSAYKVVRDGNNGIFFGNASNPIITVRSDNNTAHSVGLQVESPVAAATGLVVKGASSQSANLVEYKNSSNTVVGWVNPDGEFVDDTGLANRRRNHIGTVSSSTISFNCQNRFQSVVISGSCTLSVSNAIDGPVCTLRISHAADNATIAWPNTFTWVGGVEPTLSSTTGSVDQITFQWDAGLGSFLCSAGIGFAAP